MPGYAPRFEMEFCRKPWIAPWLGLFGKVAGSFQVWPKTALPALPYWVRPLRYGPFRVDLVELMMVASSCWPVGVVQKGPANTRFTVGLCVPLLAEPATIVSAPKWGRNTMVGTSRCSRAST